MAFWMARGQDCSNPPNAVIANLCGQIAQWQSSAAESAASMPRPAPSPQSQVGSGQAPQAALPPRNPFPTRAVRKEFRMMSAPERRRFGDVLRQLKNSGQYDRVVRQHASNQAFGAHGGPAFLPWHRQYLSELEVDIRNIDSSLAVPYWDSTLDEPLPNAADSVLWTEALFGDTDGSGVVASGPFSAPWPTSLGERGIRRAVGQAAQFGARLFSEADLASFRRRATYEQLAQCPLQVGDLEITHGLVHVWVGGHMETQEVSPNDPVFFMHHCFVDLIWELWRRERQTPQQRQSQYHTDSLSLQCDRNGFHNRAAPMRPFFGVQNADGIGNKYTEEFYDYEPRPSCSAARPDCGSPFLFCQTVGVAPRCVARVRLGGNCVGFEGESVCFDGQCIDGRCRSADPTPDCSNWHPCCTYWASVDECARNPRYMNQACQPSCSRCTQNVDTSQCSDYNTFCPTWASAGECSRTADWMEENCRRSCNLCHLPRDSRCRPQQACTDSHVNCDFWSTIGECAANPTYMLENCRLSCRVCS